MGKLMDWVTEAKEPVTNEELRELLSRVAVLERELKVHEDRLNKLEGALAKEKSYVIWDRILNWKR